MSKKKIVIILAILLVLIGIIVGVMVNKNKETDAYRFSQEYKEIDADNVFVYRDIDEIIKILENGTGVVYLGFPECKWCQRYVTYLNEVAQYEGIEKIYYYNIKEDRANNTLSIRRLLVFLVIIWPMMKREMREYLYRM